MPKTAEILGRSAVLYGGELHFQTTGPVHQHRRPSPTVSCTAMYCVVFVSSVFDCGGDDRLTSHLSGKPGNVREFDSCHGNVRDFTKSQGNVREIILSGKSCLKLFIVSCIFASILDFAEFVHFILVSDHALLHSNPPHH